ncbi:MAG: hypothetical protein ACRDBG_07810 [Waterburya sp.]
MDIGLQSEPSDLVIRLGAIKDELTGDRAILVGFVGRLHDKASESKEKSDEFIAKRFLKKLRRIDKALENIDSLIRNIEHVYYG